jgi:two-component system, HptB-dependent secretion and biofilm response regulator
MVKILIADDLSINRSLLKQTLSMMGDYDVVEAVDGEEAVNIFKKEQPDIVLMDIMMPGLDGYQATKKIKEILGDEHVPIIFLTAASSDDSLSAALESGGDDFISKPFNIEVLSSKIHAHLRIRNLSKELKNNNTLLSDLNQHLVNEHILIEHFFDSAIKQSFLDNEIIQYHMSSLSAFNGDLLLVERGAEGRFYVVMGDFTGHGLTAAMGTIPVAMTFFSMTRKGFSIGEIASEINHQLYSLMPQSMFFCANIFEVNMSDGILSAWCGGMPENYVFSKDGLLKQLIESKHMPLGILDENEFDSLTQIFNIEYDDKIYLYSDGVIEAKDASGNLFGDERLKNTLISGGDNRFDDVLNELKQFTGEDNQKDDITLVQLNCREVSSDLILNEKEIVESLDWKISISISEKDIKSYNPISRLFSILSSLPFISHYKDALHVLIFEIYNNVLDHSILNLDSMDKSDPEKFSEYYVLRDRKIKELEYASIEFHFSFIRKNNKKHLEISVTDSGNGYQKRVDTLSDKMSHGRGLAIIEGFCEEMSFSDDGKMLTVLYLL